MSADPFVAYRGVVNAASSMPAGLPGGGIARGSAFSIYGRRLGPPSSPTLSFPLQTTLGGVSITITQGSTTVNAIPTFISPGQINAIMPSNAPLGLVTLRVNFNGRGNATPVRVVNSSFGIFAANSAGSGPGIFQNFVAADQLPVNTLNGAARRGQVVILWGTGLGPVPADNVAPTPGNLSTPTEVFVGGVSATVQYSGRSPCCAAIDQIVFTIPADAPLGCWVPVYVRTDRAAISNFTTIAIAGEGVNCSEMENPLVQTLIAGGRSASFVAARFSIRADQGVTQLAEGTSDVIGGFLAEQNAGPFNFNPMLSLPPAGSCTAYGIRGAVTRAVPVLPGALPTGRGLDAGAITIRSPRGTQTVAASRQSGVAMRFLGASLQLFPQLMNLFFDGSSISLMAAGGADVGAFTATTTVPQSLAWTNRDQLSVVNRSQGFTVNWSGAATGHTVFISGGSVDVPTDSSSLFVCRALPGATSFRIPPDVLWNIAPSRGNLTESPGAVYVGQWNLASPVAFTATGISSGSLLGAQVIVKTVVFQ